MKKVLFGIVAAMAIFALAAPAPAAMKLTTKGYYEVNGMYISNNPIDSDSRANDWYNMEMIVEPILHVTDKVRFHSQIAIMERNWSGSGFAASSGNLYADDAAQKKYDIFDNEQNNFWVERLYLAVDLFDGVLTVGRMSGGAFGYAFSDNETNADRIKYVRRFGTVTMGAIIEKSAELDGGQQAPRLPNMPVDPSWDASDNDIDSGGLFFVVPLGKMGLYRQLLWAIRYGNPRTANPAATDSDPTWRYYSSSNFGFNLGMLKIDFEFIYNYREDKNVQLADRTRDIEFTQYAFWGELGVAPGPFELYGGGFYIQGEDSKNENDSSRVGAFANVGRNYEPSLLLFSEDMGILYGTGGLPNGSIGSSGIWAGYLRGGYKLTDTMKLTAVGLYCELAEMETSNVDQEIGWEFDLGFEWKFMPNVSYIVDGGYFIAGDFFKDVYPDQEDVYGVRNTIRVEW